MEQKVLKNKKNLILKDVVYLFCFLLFAKAKILSLINPFSVAFLFCLVWCGENIWNLSLIYLISNLTRGLALSNILPSLICVLVLILCAIIQKASKRRVNKPVMCFYFAISQLGNFIFTRNLYFASIEAVSIFISMILFACFSIFFQALLQRRANFKLNVDEVFCAGVFLMSLGCAFASISIFSVNIGMFFELFLILTFLSVLGFSKGVISSLILGVGYFLATENIYFFAFPIIFALLCGIFAETNKYLTVGMGITTTAVLGFYFNLIPNFSFYQAGVCIFSCLMFLFVNKKTIQMLKQIFYVSNINESENFLNFSRKAKYFKFMEISKVFENMEQIYKEMLHKKLTKDESAYMLSKELEKRMCDDCPNKKVCFRQSGKDMLNEFYDMFSVGVSKKQINIIDIPNKINAKCDKSKKIFAVSNDLLSSYVSYDNMLSSINSSKLLISDQMAGVSQIIKKLAEDEKENLTFDVDKSEQIIQNLVYSNLTGVKSACVTEDANASLVVLISDGELENLNLTQQVISKTMKMPFEFSQKIESQSTKTISYLFTPSPKCDVVFGVAGKSKGGAVSGDSFSAVKISSGKFMLGICDGMGTGERANKSSDKTISLIESYYKAGFSSDQIIDNINKLYLLEDEENFSTLDLCVLDLNNLNADFIKLGAPQTFIKRKNATQMISGGALPVGAVESVSPKLEKTSLDPKDLIFMVSDGVSDRFNGEDELSHAIACLKGTNPQELAEKLLEIAKNKNLNAPDDDMTVFVSRVYRKVQWYNWLFVKKTLELKQRKKLWIKKNFT